MNKIIVFLIIILTGGAVTAQTTVDGQSISLSGFTGKKLLYIVMPGQTDTGLVNQIDRFQKKYGSNVQVIGIVKPGTNRLQAHTLLNKAMSSGMMVTEGIAARRLNSPQRESVMEWICEKRKASHESEQKEIGSKYFINEEGHLYAMLGADVSLDSPLIPSIVNTAIVKAIYQEDPSLSPEKVATGKSGAAKP